MPASRRTRETTSCDVIPPGLSTTTSPDPGSMVEVVQEAKAASALNHPHVVTAFDAESIQNTHFLVMEYVESRSLSEAIAGGTVLDPAQDARGHRSDLVVDAALGVHLLLAQLVALLGELALAGQLAGQRQ